MSYKPGAVTVISKLMHLHFYLVTCTYKAEININKCQQCQHYSSLVNNLHYRSLDQFIIARINFELTVARFVF